MNPLPAPRVLDQYFFDIRSRILDIAAARDRIDRGANADSTATDPRIVKIKRALEVLLADEPNRAEQIQRIFSLDYDPAWAKPEPKM